MNDAGLTAAEFLARNGHVASIDESRQKAVDADAWHLWLNAVELCNRSDIQLACESKSYMRDTVKVLTERLERMK